ncbi:MAG: hypothetical protein ABJH08_07120 [Balneola sp.]
MIHILKSYLLTFGTALLFGYACQSSQAVVQNETNAVDDPKVSESIDGEVNPDKKIDVTINGMVKYSFVEIDDEWQGQVTQFDSNDPQAKKVVRIMEVQPELGWEDFEDMAAFLNVYTMPDQSEIENRKAGPITDESRSYEFKVFDGNNTRSYSYFNPEGESGEHWQSQHITIFGSYIATEMKIVGEVNE